MPLVIAHRGASAGRPGNTLEAFERAIAVGADMIEFDVRRTRDGELVVVHDALVRGVPVRRLTRAQVAERGGGARPPLLAEVLELARGRAALNVELKEPGYAPQVAAALRGADRDALLVTSFSARAIADLRRAAQDVRTGLVLGVKNLGHIAPIRRARSAGATVVLLRRRYAERGVLAEARAAGLDAHVWTINDDAGLRRHLADPRIAGVITDVPERAVELRRRRGGRPSGT